MFGLKTKLFGREPRTYRQEIGGAWGGYSARKSAGLAAGLVVGTRIATTMGWRPVEAIAQGDMVLTFDHGLQKVRSVTRGAHWAADVDCPPALWPLAAPVGALGNQEAMLLLPEQSAMIESDSGEVLFGDPFQLVAAADLAGFRGIERVRPDAGLDVILLSFDDDQVLFANTGALMFCPSLAVMNMDELLRARPQAAVYNVLRSEQADVLVDCLIDEDAVSGAPATARHPGIYQAA